MSYWNPKDGDEYWGLVGLIIVIGLALSCSIQSVGEAVGKANGNYHECEQCDKVEVKSSGTENE